MVIFKVAFLMAAPGASAILGAAPGAITAIFEAPVVLAGPVVLMVFFRVFLDAAAEVVLSAARGTGERGRSWT
jgi:hypothetical protein